MKSLLIVIVLLQTIGCATSKKVFQPVTKLFNPIHLEEGMTKQQVTDQFYCQKPSKSKLSNGIDVWVYSNGQGMSAAGDRHAQQLGGYDWYVYFKDGLLVKERCVDYK
jgi:hypothetical protein